MDFDSLIIIGGGVIGMEFASIYNALGRNITVLEAAPRLLPTMDKEFSQSLAIIMKKRGAEIQTSASVSKIEPCGSGLAVAYQDKKGAECRAEAAGVLIATGRRADASSLFAEEVLPAMERGALVVDGRFETSIKGILQLAISSPEIYSLRTLQAHREFQSHTGLQDSLPRRISTVSRAASIPILKSRRLGSPKSRQKQVGPQSWLARR